MRSLKRRVEELEKATLALQCYRESAVALAFVALKRDEVKPFLSSIEAQKEGRPLNAAESAARQAYTRALEANCPSTLTSIGCVKPNPYKEFFRMLAAQTFSQDAFKLAQSGERGQREGCMREAELAIEEVKFVGKPSAPNAQGFHKSGWEGGK
jgi:hypothetical protein